MVPNQGVQSTGVNTRSRGDIRSYTPTDNIRRQTKHRKDEQRGETRKHLDTGRGGATNVIERREQEQQDYNNDWPALPVGNLEAMDNWTQGNRDRPGISRSKSTEQQDGGALHQGKLSMKQPKINLTRQHQEGNAMNEYFDSEQGNISRIDNKNGEENEPWQRKKR